MILSPLEPRRELRRYHWSKMPITRCVVDCTRWKEESNDWEIWEIGSGRDDWPMLITADETGHGWLPFAVRPAIFPSSLLSINFVAYSWRRAAFVTLRVGKIPTYTIPGVGMPTAEE
jgi:hypothetical protein